MIPIKASAIIKGINHSGFTPVSSLSRKILENAGLIIPIRLEIILVSITKATATAEPFILSLAKDIIDLGLPEGSKLSPGSNIRQIPVKDSSKTFIETV